MRIQGTDGVRGVVKTPEEAASRQKSPIKLYLDNGWLTRDFFELYCLGFALYCLKTGKAGPDGGILIGWDPRDISRELTSRAVSGLRKGGVSARVLGVAPTPLIPLAMRAWGIGAGVVVTASHNPADQNGIKIFLGPEGRKPLPEEEEEISEVILGIDPAEVNYLEAAGKSIDCGEKGVELFYDFHSNPTNSWGDHSIFGPVRLVVDAANGACSGLACDIFRAVGFKEVIEVNSDPASGINEECGVVGFEGVAAIPSDFSSIPNRAMARNRFVETLFQLGRSRREEALNGRDEVMGVVFDGDGDRFSLCVYDPVKDLVHILTGDEAAIHQARFLLNSDPNKFKGAIFVNTVESDLKSSLEAARIGFSVDKTGVGDKWLLKKAAESGDRFAVGAERSGHIITRGTIIDNKGNKLPVLAGNGIKGALNTIAAVRSLYGNKGAEERIKEISRPFEPGFNTMKYIYYTDKKKWERGGVVWGEAKKNIAKAVLLNFGQGITFREKRFSEERNLLFLEIVGRNKQLLATIHVRNSGTEEKTGITVKGSMNDRDRLSNIVEQTFKDLAGPMKNPEHPFCVAQKKLIRLLSWGDCVSKDSLPPDLLPEGSVTRFLREVGAKEGMIKEADSGLVLTELGKWYYTHCGALPKTHFCYKRA